MSERNSGAAPDRAAARRALRWGLVLTGLLAVGELIGGWISGSLALMGDALHMGTDMSALGVSIIALWIADRPADARRSYGSQRVEILASLMLGMVLVGLAVFLVHEAIERLKSPRELLALPMLAVAVVGLVVNLVVLRRLHHQDHHMGVRAALLHVLGDTVSSVAVVVGAVVIAVTGWVWVDPALTLLVACIILLSTYGLLREAVDILLESVPADLESAEVLGALQAVPGVREVHDLHIWCLTPAERMMSVHVVAEDAAADRDGLLRRLKEVLRERFGLGHTTIQLQGPDYDRDEEALHHVAGCCDEDTPGSVHAGGAARR
jgi:cobalt-zinc-cadmium efflux system protein